MVFLPTLVAILVVALLLLAVNHYRSRVKESHKFLATVTTVGAVVVIGVIVGASFKLIVPNSRWPVPNGVTWETFSWRAHLFARKAEGGLPDLSWRELWFMLHARGGFGLEDFVR